MEGGRGVCEDDGVNEDGEGVRVMEFVRVME